MDDLLITASLFALCAACALSIARRIIKPQKCSNVKQKRNEHSLFLMGFPALATRRIWTQSVKTRLPLLTKTHRAGRREKRRAPYRHGPCSRNTRRSARLRAGAAPGTHRLSRCAAWHPSADSAKT